MFFQVSSFFATASGEAKIPDDFPILQSGEGASNVDRITSDPGFSKKHAQPLYWQKVEILDGANTCVKQQLSILS